MIELDKKILIIDDQPEIIEVIKEIFEEKLENIVIESTTCTDEALRLIKSYKYNLICCDHIMPSMTGIELIREVRSSNNPNKNIGILLISAMDVDIEEEVREFQFVKLIDKIDDIQNVLDSALEFLNS